MIDPSTQPSLTEMKQLSFASSEHAMKKRVTRHEEFLAEMEALVSWARWMALIELLYPKSGRIGCPPIGVARMLRMYCVEQGFGFEEIKALLGEKGLLMREGTLVDATIIAAAQSTKNKDHARDPEMVSGESAQSRTTKKGNQWHFGMKAWMWATPELKREPKLPGPSNTSPKTRRSCTAWPI